MDLTIAVDSCQTKTQQHQTRTFSQNVFHLTWASFFHLIQLDRSESKKKYLRNISTFKVRSLAVDGSLSEFFVGGKFELGRVDEVFLDQRDSGGLSLSDDEHGLAVGPVVAAAKVS